jgi:broad specificity phosphatase PhoE
MTRLILIRHGETDGNVENRRQGRKDSPLNAKGIAQTARVCEYVNANFDFNKVWSSPLQRCTNTASGLDAEVITSDLLIELDYGEWEGILESEIAAQHPNRYQNGQLSMDPPGGEKRSNLPIRGREFLLESELGSGDIEGDVVIVGHSSALTGLLVTLLDLPDYAMHNLVIDNCSVSTVDIDNGINRLMSLNYIDHLATLDNI